VLDRVRDPLDNRRPPLRPAADAAVDGVAGADVWILLEQPLGPDLCECLGWRRVGISLSDDDRDTRSSCEPGSRRLGLIAPDDLWVAGHRTSAGVASTSASKLEPGERANRDDL
jgi:hypothetical protein